MHAGRQADHAGAGEDIPAQADSIAVLDLTPLLLEGVVIHVAGCDCCCCCCGLCFGTTKEGELGSGEEGAAGSVWRWTVWYGPAVISVDALVERIVAGAHLAPCTLRLAREGSRRVGGAGVQRARGVVLFAGRSAVRQPIEGECSSTRRAWMRRARGYLNGRGRWWAWCEVWDGGVGVGINRLCAAFAGVLELGGPDCCCCCPLTEKDKFAVSPPNGPGAHHATLALWRPKCG